jgi:hypothetical protein
MDCTGGLGVSNGSAAGGPLARATVTISGRSRKKLIERRFSGNNLARSRIYTIDTYALASFLGDLVELGSRGRAGEVLRIAVR